jgi:RNA polymerase sigma-70 factor (ECF subfamily)
MASRGETDGESDESIVHRVLGGDVDAFELLVERHAPRVRRIVSRNVPRAAAEEVAHDAFVAAYLSLSTYVASHPFERWLVRIALRVCADHWRERARASLAGGSTGLDVVPGPPAPPREDDRDLCEWALGRLGREDREVLVLVHVEELGVKECAELLSWSESKVKVRAHRARIRLRRLLRAAHEERGRER